MVEIAARHGPESSPTGGLPFVNLPNPMTPAHGTPS
jgi:hypothetical protein